MRATSRLTRAGFVLAALVAAAPVGCASSEPGTVDTVTVKLGFGGDVTLTSVNYTLRGRGTFIQTGTLPVGADDTLTATFQNLPVAAYTITVTGSASDNMSSCTGSASFNVTGSMTAMVNIPLVCTGLASVSATIESCPVIDSLSALPAEVFVGSPLALTLVAHDLDNAPAPLTAMWSTTSGTLTNDSITGATFTCTAAGTVTIMVRVSDGMPTLRCADTASLAVVCTPPV